MYLKKRYRIGSIAAGIALILLGVSLGSTSTFTPFLIVHPWLLSAVASASTVILLPIALFLAGFGLFKRQVFYQWVGFIFLLAVALFSYWQPAYQLPLTGLTLGGSLVLLGYAPGRFTIKKSSHVPRASAPR